MSVRASCTMQRGKIGLFYMEGGRKVSREMTPVFILFKLSLPLFLSLWLSHFISINRQTLGSWGVVHAEQMHPVAVSLHSPHNEPDGTRTDRCRHFHSPQDRGRGHTLPWRRGFRAKGAGAGEARDPSALISCLPPLPHLFFVFFFYICLPSVLFHSAP